MSILSKIFGGGSNPAGAAMPYLNQIPGVAHGTYDPYVTEGRDASGRTSSAYHDMMNDPKKFLDWINEGYEPSQAYQTAKKELENQMSNTAAAGGVAGTKYDQDYQSSKVHDLLTQDQQQYLQNALGIYNRGLSGEEGVATRGYDASGKLNDILVGNLNQQGSLGFQGQSQQNSNQQALIKMIAQALGAMGGFGGFNGVGGGLSSGMYGGG